jgi:hypothetical protein
MVIVLTPSRLHRLVAYLLVPASRTRTCVGVAERQLWCKTEGYKSRIKIKHGCLRTTGLMTGRSSWSWLAGAIGGSAERQGVQRKMYIPYLERIKIHGKWKLLNAERSSLQEYSPLFAPPHEIGHPPSDIHLPR